MRPFETLGLKPFLFADDTARAEIQREFLRLSRETHPDRFMNESEERREEAESRSAMLNADHAVLRDPWKLIDRVLADNPDTAAMPSKAALPPTLAAEYFELQEAWLEDPKSPELAEKLAGLKAEVSKSEQATELEVMAIAQQFPYAGLGQAEPTWTNVELAKLRAAVHKLRYFRSFGRDLDAKFGSR